MGSIRGPAVKKYIRAGSGSIMWCQKCAAWHDRRPRSQSCPKEAERQEQEQSREVSDKDA